MAGAGTFEVVIKGKGGHAAAGVGVGVVDPTIAAAAAITAIQSVVAREVAPVSFIYVRVYLDPYLHSTSSFISTSSSSFISTSYLHQVSFM
jgi:hypothetical protein